MDDLTLRLLKQNDEMIKQFQKEAKDRHKAESKQLRNLFKSLKKGR